MKVLFLDIDGVANSSEWLFERGPRFEHPNGHTTLIEGHEMDPAMVELINEAISRSGAKVVVSSSWRVGFQDPEDLFDALRRYGLVADFIGVTPRLGVIRGREIAAWLGKHPEVSQFLILDDESDMGVLLPYLVKTEWTKGIQREHVELLVERFGSDAQS